MNSISHFLYPLYAVVCVYLYIFILRKKCPQTAFFGLVTSLLIPPFGLIFALAQLLPDKQSEIKKIRNDVFVISLIDADTEKFRVPMSEAVILNDQAVCCTLLMDALKNDASKYIVGIKEALMKGDPETAHYAAAAVMELQRVLLNKVRQLDVYYQKRSYSNTELLEYIDTLKKTLDLRIFDSDDESWLESSLEEVLNFIVNTMPSPRAYSDRIDLALHKRNYTEALKYASEYLVKYPCEEDAYMYIIQTLLGLRDVTSLQALINSLLIRPIELTDKTLQYIRFLTVTGIVTS